MLGALGYRRVLCGDNLGSNALNPCKTFEIAVARYSVKVSEINVRCSIWCAFAEPVAGLAAS